MNYIKIKNQVKIMRSFFKEKDILLCLGHCYELVALMNGFENWDTFRAHLKKLEKYELVEFEL